MNRRFLLRGQRAASEDFVGGHSAALLRDWLRRGRAVDHEAALDLLRRQADFERDPASKYGNPAYDLDRFRRFLSLLGHPEAEGSFIHVAGTKGKGSTAAMAASILSGAGLRVGLYTSPHLERVEERVRVGLDPIPPEVFARRLTEMAPALDPAADPSERPTYFEILTALAFRHFKAAAMEVSVIEVGLGGRLDATNVIRPEVCAITHVSLDHTELLGATPREIAREKAGILKPGAAAVTSAEGEALEEIREAAARVGAALEEAGVHLLFESEPAERSGIVGSRLEIETRSRRYRDLFLPLPGAHQAGNAALAVRACELWSERRGRSLSEEAVRGGLARVRWPGRLEIAGRNPWQILDGAHNPGAALVLARALREYFPAPRWFLVLAMARDKDVRGFLQGLAPPPAAVFACRYDHPRARPSDELAREAREILGVPAKSFGRPIDAWSAACAASAPSDLVCATGSLYLVGEMRRALNLG